jgi:flagellar basal-body rod modification protein FlgD
MESQLQLNRNKQDYLLNNKQVDINRHLQNAKAKDSRGMNNVEIRKKAKSLGRDEFFQLLIKQLTHQDPTKPMNDTQFIAQMAQFYSLEQMKDISKNMDTMNSNISQVKNYQVLNLVDKHVMGKDFVSGKQINGVVKAVFFDDKGRAFIRMNEGIIQFNDIISVGAARFFEQKNQIKSKKTPAIQKNDTKIAPNSNLKSEKNNTKINTPDKEVQNSEQVDKNNNKSSLLIKKTDLEKNLKKHKIPKSELNSKTELISPKVKNPVISTPKNVITTEGKNAGQLFDEIVENSKTHEE